MKEIFGETRKTLKTVAQGISYATVLGAEQRRKVWVRDALYMAALNSVRRDRPLRTFYRRLRERGKPAKLALIAVARKLLTILNAIIRDRKPYEIQQAT